MSLPHKIKTWLWPLLIVLLSVAIFQYLKITKPQAEPPEITERAWAVEVMALELKDWHSHHTLYGRVESQQRIKLSASMAAEVTQLPFKEGASFQPGDTLIALNPTEVRLSVQVSQADYDEAKAAHEAEQQAQKTEIKRLEQEQALFKIKQSDLARNQKLVERDLASASSIDLARDALARQQLALLNAQLTVDQQAARLTQLKARLDRAQANLKRSQINADRAHVQAVFDGRVAQVMVAEGDQVSANAPLLDYYPLNSLELRTKLPIKERLKVQQALDNGTKVQAWYRYQDREHAMTLSRLGGDASSSGLDGFFKIPVELTSLRPGDVLEVTLKMPNQTQAFAVPYSALYSSERVYVVVDDRLVSRQIKVEGEVDLNGVRWVLIQGELSENDRLSVTHLPNAISGLLVSPQSFNGQRGQR